MLVTIRGKFYEGRDVGYRDRRGVRKIRQAIEEKSKNNWLAKGE